MTMRMFIYKWGAAHADWLAETKKMEEENFRQRKEAEERASNAEKGKLDDRP